MIAIKFFFLGLFLKAAVAPQLTATLSESKVRPNEDFELSISVSTDEEVNLEEPEWKVPEGIKKLGMQPNKSFSSHMILSPQGAQMKKTHTVDFVYHLQSAKEGNYKLGPFVVEVANQKFNLGSVELLVSNKVPPPSRQQRGGGGLGGLFPPGFDDEEDSLFGQLLRRHQKQEEQAIPSRKLPVNEKEAFFITVETDKKEAYEGEQVFASWYIYTRGNIHQLDRLKFPSLKGFWKEDVEPAPNLNFQKEIVNGVLFHRALLASYALFPIKAGVSVIDEYKIRASVSLPSENQGIFGQFGFGKAYTYTRTSDPLKLQIKSLPESGRTQSFSGAVGNFKIEAHVDTQNFVQGQPFTLKLKFEGDGNAKLIELPKLQWPASFELYDTKSDSKFFQSGKSYKEFMLLLIPKESGVLKIPPFDFSYFDPVTSTYKTIQTQEIALQVIPGVMQPGLKSERIKVDGVNKNEDGSEPTLVLPSPETRSLERSWRWIHGFPMVLIWGGMYLLLVIIFILGHWLWLRKLISSRSLMDELRDRKQKCDKLITSDKLALGAAEVINATYYLLGRLVDKEGFNKDLIDLLEHLPPSVRNEVFEPLRKELELLQTIAFAPSDAWKNYSSSREVRKHSDRAFQILEQSLRLSEEAG